MEQFLHLIVNKQSRNSEAAFKKLLVQIPRYTQNYKIYSTETTNELDEIVRDLKTTAASSDLVIVIGGDGSLNYLVTLFEKYNLDNYIGYIPSGSGNDFARSHNMPLDTDLAIKHIFELKEPKEVSIIHAVQGEIEYFAVNSLGIGIDGLVISRLNERSLKRVLGPTSYISGVVSAFVQQKKFPITLKVDEGIYTFDNVQLALIANNPYFGGGIKIAPDADGTDDVLDVVIGEDVSGRDLVSILRRLVSKKKSHLSHPKLHHFTTKSIALYSEAEQYGQKDGELIKQEGVALQISTKKRKFWI